MDGEGGGYVESESFVELLATNLQFCVCLLLKFKKNEKMCGIHEKSTLRKLYHDPCHFSFVISSNHLAPLGSNLGYPTCHVYAQSPVVSVNVAITGYCNVIEHYLMQVALQPKNSK
jgi:hypothetical protein